MIVEFPTEISLKAIGEFSLLGLCSVRPEIAAELCLLGLSSVRSEISVEVTSKAVDVDGGIAIERTC